MRRFVLLLALAACDPKPVTPAELCEGFIAMIQRERRPGDPVLSEEALEMKREKCLTDNHHWSVEAPEEFQHMARCSLGISSAVGWARCGFGQQGQ